MRILWALTEDGAFVRWGTLLAFVLFVVLGISKADDDAEGHVTCGSILKIRDSGTGVTLRSRDAIMSVLDFVGKVVVFVIRVLRCVHC